MVKYKVVKIGKTYYARVYNDSGFLLDSLGFGKKTDAEKSLRRLKAKKFFK